MHYTTSCNTQSGAAEDGQNNCHRPATSWVHYTTSCNTHSSVPEDGQNKFPKNVELTGIINKPLLLHLVGCLYYLYFFFFLFFLRLAKQSQFIPLQNVVYFITLLFLVRKIFTFYIIDVLLFKCPIPVQKGCLTNDTIFGKKNSPNTKCMF